MVAFVPKRGKGSPMLFVLFALVLSAPPTTQADQTFPIQLFHGTWKGKMVAVDYLSTRTTTTSTRWPNLPAPRRTEHSLNVHLIADRQTLEVDTKRHAQAEQYVIKSLSASPDGVESVVLPPGAKILATWKAPHTEFNVNGREATKEEKEVLREVISLANVDSPVTL